MIYLANYRFSCI